MRDNPLQFNEPPARMMRAAIVARTMLAEDELRRTVKNGVKQCVVLGAGLDTFAIRNPYREHGLRTYEVDHPSTQRWKQNLLAGAAIAMPESAVSVPVDFRTDALAERLMAAGWRMDEPTCFSWLGVSIYLTNEGVLDILRSIGSLPKGSSITFDYRVPAAMLAPLERMKVQAHWQTDVLAGWTLGTAAGYYAHSRNHPFTVMVWPRGVTVGWHKQF